MPATAPTSSTTSDAANTEVRASSKEDEKKPDPVPSATFAELYQFTSLPEKFLLFLAALFATGSGLAMPMMLLAFGDAFEQLGVSETVSGASTDASQMLDMFLTFVWIGLGIFGGRFFYHTTVEMICHSQLLEYKRAYLKAVLRQDVGWYDTSNPEELATRFAEAMIKVQKGLSAASFALFEGLGYGLGGFVMGFYFQPEVAAITLATVPMLVLPASVIFWIVENGAKVVSKAYGRAGGIATEALFSMRTVASLGLERELEARYAASLGGAKWTVVKQKTAMGFSVGLALSAYMVMMVAATIYGAYRLAAEMDDSAFDYVLSEGGYNYTYCAHEGNNSLVSTSGPDEPCAAPLVPLQMTCNYADAIAQAADSDLSSTMACAEDDMACQSSTLLQAFGFDTVSAFRAYLQSEAPDYVNSENSDYFGCRYDARSIILAIFAIMMAGEGFSMAGQPAATMSLARQAVTEILAIINRIPAIDSFSDEGLKPAAVTGTVEVRDVVFAYPTAPDHPVCKGYNLVVPAGKTVALCGASGSGKSTIIQLIERFYDPQSGVVTLDGVDIKTLNVRWLRSQLGLVGQEPVLFQGTVAMNIGYGKPGATQDEIEAAATDANAHGFIKENLADGYNTDVGLKGGRLSGGQKQRVAIARAIIKKPSVLLLDEATSALDNESERVVQAALDAVMAGGKRTTVVIAHRLSTIRNADKIAVLQEGKVVEEGTHQELLQLSGLYASLVLSQ